MSTTVVVDTASVAGFRMGGSARVDGRRVVSLIFAGWYRRTVGSAGERFRGLIIERAPSLSEPVRGGGSFIQPESRTAASGLGLTERLKIACGSRAEIRVLGGRHPGSGGEGVFVEVRACWRRHPGDSDTTSILLPLTHGYRRYLM